MHLIPFRQSLAVAYIYLLTSVTCADTALAARSLFSKARLTFDEHGQAIPVAIAKSTEPRLEVSIKHETYPGTWITVRSLGGRLSEDWLLKHRDGHSNTTVQWSNGTSVHPHQVTALLPHVRRFGWDTYLGIVIGNSNGIVVPLGSVYIAGFLGTTVGILLLAAAYWLFRGQSSGSTQAHANNASKMKAKRNNFEKNVYYSQSVGNDAMTGQWPASADMQEAVVDALQDMADHDYQGACYDLLTWIPSEGTPPVETAQLGF